MARLTPCPTTCPWSHTAGMFPRRALCWPGAASMTTGLGATLDRHHGLLGDAEHEEPQRQQECHSRHHRKQDSHRFRVDHEAHRVSKDKRCGG